MCSQVLTKEGMERKEVVISTVQKDGNPDHKCALNGHARISFKLMAMCLVCTVCVFNEREKKDQMKKAGGVEIKDMN